MEMKRGERKSSLDPHLLQIVRCITLTGDMSQRFIKPTASAYKCNPKGVSTVICVLQSKQRFPNECLLYRPIFNQNAQPQWIYTDGKVDKISRGSEKGSRLLCYRPILPPSSESGWPLALTLWVFHFEARKKGKFCHYFVRNEFYTTSLHSTDSNAYFPFNFWPSGLHSDCRLISWLVYQCIVYVYVCWIYPIHYKFGNTSFSFSHSSYADRFLPEPTKAS